VKFPYWVDVEFTNARPRRLNANDLDAAKKIAKMFWEMPNVKSAVIRTRG
jgi:hypothetical protein